MGNNASLLDGNDVVVVCASCDTNLAEENGLCIECGTIYDEYVFGDSHINYKNCVVCDYEEINGVLKSGNCSVGINIPSNTKVYSCCKPFSYHTTQNQMCECYREKRPECFPVCKNQKKWLNEEVTDEFDVNERRNFCLNSDNKLMFRYIEKFTNVTSPQQKLDMVIWIARYCHTYQSAIKWIIANCDPDYIIDTVGKMYPGVAEDLCTEIAWNSSLKFFYLR